VPKSKVFSDNDAGFKSRMLGNFQFCKKLKNDVLPLRSLLLSRVIDNVPFDEITIPFDEIVNRLEKKKKRL